VEEGYIKLSRKMLDWEWYSDVNTKTVFLHCLFKANWKDGRFKGQDIKRGQFVTSLQHLADETNLSVKNVRTALDHLKATGEVADHRQGNYRIITVLNYCRYQDCDNPSADHRQAIGNPSATIEERKKERREEEYISSSSKDSEDIRQTETVRQGNSEDVKKVVEAWNSLAEYGISGISKMSSTSTRYKNLTARLKQYSLEEVLTAIEKIKNSDFLLGRKKDWRIDFDWFVKPNNFPKVLDGNYLNKEKGVEVAKPTWFTDDTT